MSTVATSIEDRVKKEVSMQLGIRPEDIRNDANIYHDLGADSLDAVELLMAIEDEFRLEVCDEDAENMGTVQQMVDYINKAQGLSHENRT
jgi:acyl carrier protein